jgi:hypothetical protein
MTVDPTDARAELVMTLMQKVQQDRFPSTTMLDLVESLLTPEELPSYVVALQDKIRAEQFPSIPLLQRLSNLVTP